MSKIIALLDQLESHIPNAETLNPKVSQATIGWQIDHSLKVINGVISALKESDPGNFRPKFNLTRSYFLLVKRIPRGKIKAPKAVRSYEEITVDQIRQQLQTAKSLVAILPELQRKNYFTHPFLGQFGLKQTLIFLELHTLHHLKIINDILKK